MSENPIDKIRRELERKEEQRIKKVFPKPPTDKRIITKERIDEIFPTPPKGRVVKGKKPEDIYSEIRKEKTREILETGKKWILVSPNGIPVAQITTEEVIEALKYVKELQPFSLDDVKVVDLLLNGKTYTGREFLREYEYKR